MSEINFDLAVALLSCPVEFAGSPNWPGPMAMAHGPRGPGLGSPYGGEGISTKMFYLMEHKVERNSDRKLRKVASTPESL